MVPGKDLFFFFCFIVPYFSYSFLSLSLPILKAFDLCRLSGFSPCVLPYAISPSLLTGYLLRLRLVQLGLKRQGSSSYKGPQLCYFVTVF